MQLKPITVVLIWLVLFLHLLTAASSKAVNTNRNIRHSDQSAVMDLAINIKETGRPFITDANRHPLFAWLLTPFASWSKESFAKAKIVTFITFCAFFLLIALFFYNRLTITGHMWLSASLALPAGLSLFSVTLVTDPLFTLINGLSILFFAYSFKENKYAFAGGIIAGFAFLSKYSGFMALLVYLAFISIVLFVKFIRRKHEYKMFFTKAVLALIGFLATASPLLLYSLKTHGSPFYNVNSKYYMWTDSWDEAKRFSGLSGDRLPTTEHKKLLAAISHDSIPGAVNYIKQHSTGYMFFRMLGGYKAYFNAHFGGRLKALFLLAAALLIFSAALYRSSPDLISSRLKSLPSLFIIFYLIIFFGSLIWYAAVSINIRYLYPGWAIACASIAYLLSSAKPYKAKVSSIVVFTMSFSALALIIFADFHSLPPSFDLLENSAVNWLK
ncbi:MAG: hypothetical protein JNL74_15345 [Fibrobacteres bacterium]|nr:hypothetical protein [Fibrobacterota bacterium]